MSKIVSIADYFGDGFTTSFTLPSQNFTQYKHLLVYNNGLFVKQLGNTATVFAITPAPFDGDNIKVTGAVDFSPEVNLIVNNLGTPLGLVNPADPSQIVLGVGKRTRIISSFGGWTSQNVSQSNGTTQLSATDRILCRPWADANDIQVIMVNGYGLSNGRVVPNGNAVLASVSIENGSAPYPQFSFRNNTGVKANTDTGGGRTGHFIGDGEITISEPLGFPLLVANTNYIHSYHKVNTTEKFPTSGIPNTGEGNQTSDAVWGSTVLDGKDNTTSYVSMGNYATGGYGFYPAAILGKFIKPVAVTLISGDSLAEGTAGGTGIYLGKSYTHVALDAANLRWSKAAVSGCTMQSFAANQIYVGILGAYVDTVAWVMGTNDITSATLVQLQNNLYACLARFSGSPRFILSTLPPRPASSSDAWATVTNQTLGAYESVRVAYNNWLRSTAISWGINLGLNIVKVNDVCLGVEYNLNNSITSLVNGLQETTGLNTGGYWKAAATTDGIHPNNTAIDIMKLNIDVSANTTGFGYIVY